jgi:hypothetical protein
MGDLVKAERLMKESINSCIKLYGNENIELARGLFNLGIILKKKNLLDESYKKIK